MDYKSKDRDTSQEAVAKVQAKLAGLQINSVVKENRNWILMWIRIPQN